MKLLFYTAAMDKAENRLFRIIQSSYPSVQTDIHRTIESLNRRLRQPLNGLNIAVLLTSSRKELLNLLALRDLFWNLRIILIIPDHKTETIAMGHILRPRFLSYIDGNFSDVGAVLKKMLNNNTYRSEPNDN